MPTVPFTNETGKFVHVGGTTIPPYGTRDVDAACLPGAAAPAPVAQPADNAHLAALLAHSVADVVDQLGNLHAADLPVLADLERAGKNRKTLIEAIEKEDASRANEVYLAELLAHGAETVIAALGEMEPSTLAQLIETETAGANRAAVLEAAAAEQLKRA